MNKEELLKDWEKEELTLAIDWNNIIDPLDKIVWDRLTENFWLPERVPLSNDLQTWRTLTESEKLATIRVFTGLTLLDTIQGRFGATALMEDANTPHEEAVLANLAFMESVHAKSYSSVFSTLLSSREIEEAFRWSRENEHLKKKQAIVKKFYRGKDPGKKKIISVLLESFLFYSGFYMPFYWASKAKLTNTADLIRLILRDEAVHGAYIGGKFQQYFQKESPERQEELRDFAYTALEVLYENEEKYTDYLYSAMGIAHDVKAFLKYNGNKALANLGFEAKYPAHECRVSASILTSLDPSANETHDFFSGAGASYVMGESKRVEITEDAWSSITSNTEFDDFSDEDDDI